MNILPYAVGGLLGGTLLKSLFKSKKPTPAPMPVTQDTARDKALRNDELLRRRGGAADIVTSPLGAPGAVAAGKTTLGS